MAERRKDYYKTLGIAKDAGEKEIKSAYRRLSKEHRPDVSKTKMLAEEKFKEIQEAYETLKDSNRRKQYDDEMARIEYIDKRTFFDMNYMDESGMDDESMDWLEQFFGETPPSHNHIDDNLEIVLSRNEAKMGGSLLIDLPSYFGLGYGFSYSARRRFNLKFPSGVRHGEIKNMYIPELDFWIRVKFSVTR